MAEISKIQPFGSSTQYDLTDNNAPRKNGTGATGTWGISITGNAATATTASKCSSANLTDMAFTWSSSYSTGSWMLIYNGEDGANGGKLFRGINQANTAAWVRGGASGTWGINITGSAGSVAWGNVTDKPSTFTPSSHTHAYLPMTVTSSCDVNNVSQGLYIVNAGITGAPLSNHGVLLYISSVGTPFQIYMPDNLYYMYKRIYSGEAWSGWQIMNAAWA